MSPVEAAWLAGFYDGEGFLVTYPNRHGNITNVKLGINNTTLVALEQCQRFTGVGSIRPKKVEANRKSQWCWEVNGKRNVKALCEQLLPFLVVKHDACRTFLDTYVEGRSTEGENRTLNALSDAGA